MAEYLQMCLPNKAPFNTGRGVRFALLDPTEKDGVILSAATLAGEDKAKLRILQHKIGVKRMLRSVTRKKGLTDDELLALPESDWMPVNEQLLEEKYVELFTSKDDEILCWAYREYHEPSQKDVEAIAGKVRTVSAD